MGSSAIWVFLFSVLLSPWISGSYGEEGAVSPLSARERDSLRYHLENYFNEMDLLIKNQTLDRFDLQRQERDLASLKVYQRIPLEPELADLKAEVIKSAKAAGLWVTHFEVPPSEAIPVSVPGSMYSSTSFHFRDEQIVEKIKFVIQFQEQASGQAIKKWAQTLPQTLVRFVKVERVSRLEKGWQVQARAYRFRNIRFPQIKSKDPLTYLPLWAKNNPAQFAQSEPVLWSFVERIRNLTPKTPTLYERRGRFFLNDARLEFFFRLTGK